MKKHDSETGDNENIEEQMTEDEAKILDELGIFGDSRKKFLEQMLAAGGADAERTTDFRSFAKRVCGSDPRKRGQGSDAD